MFRSAKFPSFFSACVLSYPQVFIVIPLLITFLISYSPLLTKSSTFEVSNTYLSKTQLIYDEGTPVDYNYALTKVIIQPNDESNALSKRFLIESLAAQAKITNNITEVSILHSPFDLWENNIERLRNDRTPLTTINKNLHKIPMFLFQGLLKVNGRVSYAKRLSFTILFPATNSDSINSHLKHNIAEMNRIKNVSKFIIFTNDSAVSSSHPNKTNDIFKFTISKLNSFDYLLIAGVYFLIISFFFNTMENMKSVKSKVGISVAIVAQLILALYTGKSITCLLFKNSPDNIPWFLVYIPIMFASLSNLFKLTMDKKGTLFIERESPFSAAQDENSNSSLSSSQLDFLDSIVKSNHYTVRTTFSMLILLIIIMPFSRKVSCFYITALIANLALQITYFSAVLSLDHRRFTYDELLALNNDDSSSVLNVSLDDGFEEKKSKWSFWIEHLSDLREWLPRTDLLSISSILAAFYMLYINTRFSSIRSSSSIIYRLFRGKLKSSLLLTKHFTKVVFDKRFISNELYKLSGSKNSVNHVLLNDPIIIVKDEINDLSLETQPYAAIASTYNSSPLNTYKFDIYYFVEFSIFLVLILVSTLLVLQLIIRKLDHYNIKLYEAKLDERKKKPSKAESLAISNSDMINKNSFHIKELSIGGHQLDIIEIATSKAPFVVSIGIDHKVLVWSPLSKPMPTPTQIPLPLKFWPVIHTVLSNDGSFVVFFNNTGRVTCWSRKAISFVWSLKLDSFDVLPPLEAFFRKRTVPGFMKRKQPESTATNSKMSMERRGSVLSLKSLVSVTSQKIGSGSGVDASYENFNYHSLDDETNDEFIFINSSGFVNVIDYKGNIGIEKITNSEHPLKACRRLLTPRMNERLVLCDQAGELFVSTVINNKWRTRKLTVLRDRFNKGYGLMTPRSLIMGASNETLNETLNDMSSITTVEPSETDNTILLIPFVGMVVRKNENHAELIDVQSGTLIRKVTIGSYKTGTLRVFHDQPTHCRFCGSASVATLSIAYTSLKNSLIMHSFQLESRTKTSICLRVERDPREIRCLGLESAVEKKYHLSNVDCWDVTENNTIIGIRRKPELIRNSDHSNAASSSMLRSASETEVDNKLHKRTDKNYNSGKRMSSFKIHDVWEGWTMNAYGKVVFHEIPTGINGLLVNRIGPLTKFGTKSIVVGFGNIMKIFYLGHEEFILDADSAGVNEENSGLKFVNKRRDRLVHKISTNYGIMNDS